MASVAIRYARAFADVASDLQLDSDKLREELHSVVELLNQNQDLRSVWDNPAVTRAEKIRLLDSIAQLAGLQTAVRNFLAVVIEHGRIRSLAVIVRQFELELDHRLGYVEPEIVSSRLLTSNEKSALEVEISKLTGHKVRANYSTDERILGGAIVKVGSTIYDGSLRGQLRRIREQLAAG